MNSYYTDTLYPLQDRVLSTVSKLKTPFYLTGGTALSRGYFHHRYSDDLDFFVNGDSNFAKYSELITFTLQNDFSVKTTHKSDSYYSLLIDHTLKVELVNDVAHHYGKLEAKSFFPKVDNVLNILSNKLSALISRDEPKDVVDIWIISKNISVDWPAIFLDVNSKAVGIFPPEITKRLAEFPIELIDLIKWIPEQKPSRAEFEKSLSKICDSILQSPKNTL